MSKRQVVFLLIFCFALRLLFFLMVKPWNESYFGEKTFTDGSVEYCNIAKSISENGKYPLSKTEWPNLFLTPVYPYFLSMFYHFLGAENLWIALMAQNIINTLSCLLIILMAAMFLDKGIALLTGVFFSLDPLFILYSCLFVSEILFTFFVIISFYLFILFLGEEKTIYLFFSAIFMGGSILTRPVAQFLPIFLAAALFFIFRKNLKNAIKIILFYSLIILLTLTPWLIRNYIITGDILVSRLVISNFETKYVVPLLADIKKSSYADAYQSERDKLSKVTGMDRDQIDYNNNTTFSDRKKYIIGFTYILNNPGNFLKLYALGIVNSFFNMETSRYVRMLGLDSKILDITKYKGNFYKLYSDFMYEKTWQEKTIGLVVFFIFSVTYIFIIVGLLISWRNRDKKILILCIIMFSYFILIAGIGGRGKYKIPSIPFYLIFTGIGCDYFLKRTTRHK